MSKKLKVQLGTKSINEAIKLLDQLDKDTNNSLIETMQELAEGAYNVILEKTPVDTGETATSTTYTVTNTKTTITQSGTHVLFNEFGTGPIGAGSKHPQIPEGWTYRDTGWYFYQDNPDSRWHGKHYTEGQPAHAQMYNGMQYIKENLPKELKKKVSVALSKI